MTSRLLSVIRFPCHLRYLTLLRTGPSISSFLNFKTYSPIQCNGIFEKRSCLTHACMRKTLLVGPYHSMQSIRLMPQCKAACHSKDDHSSTNGPNNGPCKEDQSAGGLASSQPAAGLAALLVVALLWGSYAPALKLLLSLPGHPMSPLMVNAIQSCTSSLILIAVTALNKIIRTQFSPIKSLLASQNHNIGSAPPVTKNTENIKMTLPLPSGSDADPSAPEAAPKRPSFLNFLITPQQSIIKAGLEMAVLNFLAVLLGTYGLQLTSATKSAFLTQSAGLWTPLIVAATGGVVGGTTWIACTFGLLGGAAILVDQGSLVGQSLDLLVGSDQLSTALNFHELQGQLLILSSSLFYALFTFRLGQLPERFGPLGLALMTSMFQAVLFSTAYVVSTLTSGQTGLTLCSPIDDVLKLMQSLDASSLSALIWLGVGPGALATCMQVFGQKRLPPDQAQVVYNTVPVWSAIMAAWMLGEGMGLLGWFGSSALILATLILAF